MDTGIAAEASRLGDRIGVDVEGRDGGSPRRPKDGRPIPEAGADVEHAPAAGEPSREQVPGDVVGAGLTPGRVAEVGEPFRRHEIGPPLRPGTSPATTWVMRPRAANVRAPRRRARGPRTRSRPAASRARGHE